MVETENVRTVTIYTLTPISHDLVTKICVLHSVGASYCQLYCVTPQHTDSELEVGRWLAGSYVDGRCSEPGWLTGCVPLEDSWAHQIMRIGAAGGEWQVEEIANEVVLGTGANNQAGTKRLAAVAVSRDRAEI